MISFSSDETELSKGSKRTAFPIVMSILNARLEILQKDIGNSIIGFIPEFSLSHKKIKAYMGKNGIRTEGERKNSFTVLNRWFEQECYKLVVKPLIEMQKDGPIKIQVGYDDCIRIEEILLCYYAFRGINVKNHVCVKKYCCDYNVYVMIIFLLYRRQYWFNQCLWDTFN